MIFFILAILSVCAVAKPQGPRIIGGLPASKGQFPYLAQIKPLHPVEEDEKYALTGSIISDQWILTSAIMLELLKLEDVMIVVGTNYNNDHSGWAYAVSDFIIHPNFNSSEGFDYDVGLIKVKGRIILGENVETIKLGSSIRIPPNLSLNFAAWGVTEMSNKTYSSTLYHITLKSITMAKCKKDLPEVPFDNYLKFCTEKIGGNGPCSGDSGAPLVYGTHLLGLGISNSYCGVSVEPNVFTNVGVHWTWIKEVTGV